jgi:DNA-directed RNA polymerase specialized sigma24 family protein
MNKAKYYFSVVRSELFIRRYFARYSRDPEEISDLTQEAIAALLDAHQKFRGAGKFST